MTSGTFGVDDPKHAWCTNRSNSSQTDAKNNFVNIGIVAGAHASHGRHRRPAGDSFSANGVAPGAKVVSVCACLFVEVAPPMR
jgi:hypothetical protein